MYAPAGGHGRHGGCTGPPPQPTLDMPPPPCTCRSSPTPPLPPPVKHRWAGGGAIRTASAARAEGVVWPLPQAAWRSASGAQAWAPAYSQGAMVRRVFPPTAFLSTAARSQFGEPRRFLPTSKCWPWVLVCLHTLWHSQPKIHGPGTVLRDPFASRRAGLDCRRP